jgi:hypothetical protein
MTTIITSGANVATDLIGRTIEFSQINWDRRPPLCEIRARGTVVAVTIDDKSRILVVLANMLHRWEGSPDAGILETVCLHDGQIRIVEHCHRCLSWDALVRLEKTGGGDPARVAYDRVYAEMGDEGTADERRDLFWRAYGEQKDKLARSPWEHKDGFGCRAKKTIEPGDVPMAER